MYTFLLVILIIISVVLILAILLQSGKGGGLAASFGGATSSAEVFMGTRQTANLLTRVSWWGGGAFLVIGLILSILSTRAGTPRSVLDRPFSAPAAPPPAAPAPTGAAPAIQLEQPAAPATPATPAPGTKAPSPAPTKSKTP